MADGLHALQSYLKEVSRRRAALAWRQAWTLGAGAAAAVLLVTTALIRLLGPGDLPLLGLVGAALVSAAAALAVALWPLRATPTPLQVARLVEERHGGLDDVV